MPDYNDDYATCHKTYATLVIVHPDLDPDQVTQGLGLRPTRAWRRGDIRNPHGKRPFIYPRGGWELTTEGTVQSRDVRRYIDWLLDQLDLKGRVLNQLQERGYQTVINCFWCSEYGQGGPMLWPGQMTRLGALGLELWFDIYDNYRDAPCVDRYYRVRVIRLRKRPRAT
jgi:hypothetical protein